jgi:hypothetical protein
VDAKRIIPMLGLQEGPDAARRLELAGADGLVFVEDAPGGAGRAERIRAVARSLFIPFAVACAFGQVEETLAAGADQALLTLDPEGLTALDAAAQAFGRNHLLVAVEAAWAPERGWRVATPGDPGGRDALAWMVELGLMGAGELLLSVAGAGGDPADLCQRAAHLPLAVLFQGATPELGQEALLHGADGFAYATALASPGELKKALGGRGLAFRQ